LELRSKDAFAFYQKPKAKKPQLAWQAVFIFIV